MGKQTIYRKAKYLLENEYKMSLPEIAEKLGKTYNTFRKEFTDIFLISPSQYRIQAKITRAKQLLSMGLSSKEIVEELTYQFKKITGLSPREFKKINIL